nr:transmembrane 9 superfamily member 9 [Ipomoea batatas]
MTAMLLLWAFMGVLAGYASARLYKMFKGSEWKKITLQTAFMFPGVFFAIFFVLNALIWGEKSSGAVPFGTMFALVLLWFGIAVPLVFVVYLFLYAAFYFFTKLEITKPVSGILYFGYMLIASYAFFVLTGTIGFYACFWFTRRIYSSVKID